MANKLAVDKEFKQLIPPLLEEEYRQLEQNILAKGKCLNPIILWDGIIVDGHNRFYICMAHGIEFEVKDVYFESRKEAKLWILENQMGRRNLTDAARIELALCKEELLKGLAKERLSRAGGDKYGNKTPMFKSSTEDEQSGTVRKAIAKEANVSETNLFRYKKIVEQGNPILLEKVKNGELKIGTAYRMLPKELLKQLKEADEIFDYIDEHLCKIKGKEMREDIDERLLSLKVQLQALLEKRKIL